MKIYAGCKTAFNMIKGIICLQKFSHFVLFMIAIDEIRALLYLAKGAVIKCLLYGGR